MCTDEKEIKDIQKIQVQVTPVLKSIIVLPSDRFTNSPTKSHILESSLIASMAWGSCAYYSHMLSVLSWSTITIF